MIMNLLTYAQTAEASSPSSSVNYQGSGVMFTRLSYWPDDLCRAIEEILSNPGTQWKPVPSNSDMGFGDGAPFILKFPQMNAPGSEAIGFDFAQFERFYSVIPANDGKACVTKEGLDNSLPFYSTRPWLKNPGIEFYAFLGTKGGPINVKHRWQTIENLEARYFNQAMFMCLAIGFLLALSLYNIILWVSTREKIYALYSAYVISTLLFAGTMDGFFFSTIWPQNLYYSDYFPQSLGNLSLLLFLKFASGFVSLKGVYKKLSLALQVVLGAGIFIPILYTTAAASILTHILGLLTLLYILVIIIVTRKQHETRYLSFAFAVFLICVGTWILHSAGTFEGPFWVNNLVLVGQSWEALVLAFALAGKLRKEREMRSASELAAEQAKQEAAKAHLEGVAHASVHIGDKLNSPLSVILMIAEDLQDESEKRMVLKAVDKMRDVQEALKEFRKYAPTNSVQVDLHDTPKSD
jgi:hypothetical protein